MKIERTTTGLINLMFDQIDEIQSQLNQSISGIRKTAALELSHKKFRARCPEIATDKLPLQLGSGIELTSDKG
jgi:hypothetical protein